ncbi:hypothetical protein D9613_000143 [Agrocybe pediades]|uniref:Uncharacterized protein n=1 Tax=Agrocybe pediades TaxID=84607 RepID=A0A8H4VSQ8_9AGAR|nr:hypothetical protein D9613_000143 [Agrocybe pediades]
MAPSYPVGGGTSPQKSSSRPSQPHTVAAHSNLPRNSNPVSDQAANKTYKQMGPGIGQNNQYPSPQTNQQYTTTSHSNPGSYSTRRPPDHSANHPQQTNWKPSFPPTASRQPPSQAPTSHSHYPSPHNSPFSSHHRPTAAANAHVSSANTYKPPERPVAASSGGLAQRNVPAYPPPQQISRTLSYALTTPGGSHPPSAALYVQSNYPTTSSASRYQAAPAQAISSSSGGGWHQPDDIEWLESICPHKAGYGCQVCEFGVHSSSEKCDDPAEHARSGVFRHPSGYCWCKRTY